MADSAQLLQTGHAEEALALAKAGVRDKPQDVDRRVWLFALHCVLGRWDKAGNDLGAITALDASWLIPAQVYQRSIGAEAVRCDVFAGRAKPLIMGEPEEWLAWNVQALALEAAAKAGEAGELRRRAFEAAPEYPCKVNGQACQWLSDVDRRLGPVLEAFLDGQYYWIPFGQVVRLEITPPEFLVESVWLPAKLTVQGGSELAAQLPARYPGSETATDASVLLGHRTDWVEQPDGGKPLGQKRLESEAADFGFFDLRLVEFEPRTAEASLG